MSSDRQPDHTVGNSTRSEEEGPADRPSSSADGSASRTEAGDELLPRSRRNSCSVCKRRKIRCDGGSPCGTCTRLNHDCVYAESRKKSGPKRGYVKGLEAKLAELQNVLKQMGSDSTAPPLVPATYLEEPDNNFQPQNYGSESLYTGSCGPVPDITQPNLVPPVIQDNLYDASLNDGISWEMIELGLDEPLPPQSTIDALTEIYFTKVHPTCPLIHQYRYLATVQLSRGIQQSIALHYAMWALAASSSEEFKSAHPYFYARARKYAEAAENTGRYKYLNVQHAQAWLLIALYEFKMMHFPNATMTTGRAIRLSQIMGLDRLDRLGLDVKQSLPRPIDWIDKEERRRTFWTAFTLDRSASVGTGWPTLIDERDIATNLPSSEEAYMLNEEATNISLNDAMLPENAASLSSFAGVVVMASISGRTLVHLQRPSPDEDDRDMNGEFWRTHRKMDNILLNTSLYLPSHLRLPAGSFNANIVYLNMRLQSATILLHQAAIFKAEKLRLPANVIEESKVRCIVAATEITTIMKTIAHMDLSFLSIFTPFSIFIAARIFSQLFKKQPQDDNALSSLRFLLSALLALKATCPLAESYLVQLDLEGIGLSALQQNVRFPSGLERSMAEVSVNDATDDSSWVKFVSPLVRIVEEKDDAPLTSSMQYNSATRNPTAFSSAPDGYGNVQTGNLYDQQSKIPTMTQVEYDPMNLPSEMFDSLAGLGSDSWDGF